LTCRPGLDGSGYGPAYIMAFALRKTARRPAQGSLKLRQIVAATYRGV
jgi:hypothetical protein